tara:strand:+ start:207 stop:830 length:624 start_codon:yes stop_codon:yes gene_type:complete
MYRKDVNKARVAAETLGLFKDQLSKAVAKRKLPTVNPKYERLQSRQPGSTAESILETGPENQTPINAGQPSKFTPVDERKAILQKSKMNVETGAGDAEEYYDDWDEELKMDAEMDQADGEGKEAEVVKGKEALKGKDSGSKFDWKKGGQQLAATMIAAEEGRAKESALRRAANAKKISSTLLLSENAAKKKGAALSGLQTAMSGYFK